MCASNLRHVPVATTIPPVADPTVLHAGAVQHAGLNVRGSADVDALLAPVQHRELLQKRSRKAGKKPPAPKPGPPPPSPCCGPEYELKDSCEDGCTLPACESNKVCCGKQAGATPDVPPLDTDCCKKAFELLPPYLCPESAEVCENDCTRKLEDEVCCGLGLLTKVPKDCCDTNFEFTEAGLCPGEEAIMLTPCASRFGGECCGIPDAGSESGFK